MDLPGASTASQRPALTTADLLSPRPAALTTFLVLCVLALAVPVFQIHYHARFPSPPEQRAVEVTLFVQLAALALLWPILLPNAATALAIAAVAAAMHQFAAWLALSSNLDAAAASLFFAAWVAGLAGLRSCFANARVMLLPGAVLALYTFAGAAAAYLRAEYARPALPGWLAGPLAAYLTDGPTNPIAYLPPLGLLAGSALFHILRRPHLSWRRA